MLSESAKFAFNGAVPGKDHLSSLILDMLLDSERHSFNSALSRTDIVSSQTLGDLL